MAKTTDKPAPIIRTDQGVAYMRGTCLDRLGTYAIHTVPARQVAGHARRGFRFIRHGDPEAERVNKGNVVKDAVGDQAWYGAALVEEAETAAVERAVHDAVGADRADTFLRRLFNTV